MNTKLFAVLAAGVLGATVAQANSVESANIVGYQEVTLDENFSLFTVTFKGVGAGNGYDVQDIIPLDVNGEVVSANNRVIIQKLNSDGGYVSTTYNYRQTRGGWCQGSTYLGREALLLKEGEAVCVNNQTGGKINLRVSGEVVLTPVSMTFGENFSLAGNMTPATIDIQDIIPYDSGTDTEITANNRVIIQKLTSDGGYESTTYNYRKSRGGWCQGSTVLSRGTVTFTPGQAFCLNNQTGASIVLKFKSPIE